MCDSYEYDGYYNYSPGEPAHCFGCIYLCDNFEGSPPYYCSLDKVFHEDTCLYLDLFEDDFTDDGLPF